MSAGEARAGRVKLFNRQRTIGAFSLLGTVTDISHFTLHSHSVSDIYWHVALGWSPLFFLKSVWQWFFIYDLEKNIAIRITAVNSCYLFFFLFQQVAVISKFGTGSSQLILSTGSVFTERKYANKCFIECSLGNSATLATPISRSNYTSAAYSASKLFLKCEFKL